MAPLERHLRMKTQQMPFLYADMSFHPKAERLTHIYQTVLS